MRGARLIWVADHLIDGLSGHPQQDRLGADFQEDRNALGLKRRNAIGKTNRGAHMAHPVIGGGDFCAGQLTGHIRDQPQLWCVIGDAFSHPPEVR